MNRIASDFDGGGVESFSRPRLFGPRPTVGPAVAAKAVAEDASALVRAEIELAKAEVLGSVRERATGLGMLAGAAVMAWLGLQGLLVTLALLLALVMPVWAAALVVTAVLLAGATVLMIVGRKKLGAPVSLDTTKANLEEDMAWTRAHLQQR